MLFNFLLHSLFRIETYFCLIRRKKKPIGGTWNHCDPYDEENFRPSEPIAQEEIMEKMEMFGSVMMGVMRQCQMFMDKMSYIPCVICNSSKAIFYDDNSFISHFFENHLDDPALHSLVAQAVDSRRATSNFATPQVQDPQPSTSGITKGRKILKPKRKKNQSSIRPRSDQSDPREIRCEGATDVKPIQKKPTKNSMKTAKNSVVKSGLVEVDEKDPTTTRNVKNGSVQ